MARWIGARLAIAGLAAILAATLFPNPGQAAASAETPLHCIVCGAQGGADLFRNLLLFTPLAVGLRLLGWRWLRIVAVSALLSFAVEFTQFAVVPGRDPTLSDLLTNTTGAAVSAALAPYLVGLLAPEPRLARRLFGAAIAAWLAVLVMSAFALRPYVLAGRLRSDCTASPGASDPFAGTVRSLILNGDSIPCDAELVNDGAIRAALERGEATLHVSAVSVEPVGGRALLHTIGVPGGFQTIVAQEGRSAVFSVPTQGQRLRLHPPTLRLPNAFPADSGVPVQLHAGERQRRIWMGSSYLGQQQTVELALSPSHGWSALLPWRLQLSPRLRLFTALWLAGLIGPAAYWAVFVRSPAAAGAVIAAAVALGLALLPRLTGYAAVHWSEWLGAIVGLVAGWALHWPAAYLQTRCGSPSTSAYSSV